MSRSLFRRLARSLSLAVLFQAFSVFAGATTIVVNSTADTTVNDGVCTLREAILAANTNTASGPAAGECAAGVAGLDTIAFNISGVGVHTISPASILPSITEAVLLDGYTQPGASPNTLAVGNNAVLLIEIDGSGTGGGFPAALGIMGPNGGSTIRGLVINRFGSTRILIGLSTNSNSNTITGNFIGSDPTGTAIPAGPNPGPGIAINGSSNTIGGITPAARNLIVVGGAGLTTNVEIGNGVSNLIQGNYLSTNAAGTAALGLTTDGITVDGPSGSNTIGGTAPGAGNVIVTQRFGIRLNGASNNVIQGNLIGTDAAGTTGLGFTIGITTGNGAGNSTIGGAAAGAGNVISGGNVGISIGDAAGGWIIQGNRIGTDITGTLPIPNSSYGIRIAINDPSGVNKIGGTNPGEGNTIAFNGAAGVFIALTAASSGFSILGNSIRSNGGLGIDLNGDGVTANDACDADAGPNGLQNYPILTTAFVPSPGNTTIQGTLNAAASTIFRVEFFSNATCDPSSNGEGQTFLGFTNVLTDGSCNTSFNVTLPVSVGPTARLTATATDPNNNTSEFSTCISLQAEFHTIQPCRIADTRLPPGPYGGPALDTTTDRSFVIAGQCSIPLTAQAVAFNFAIVQPTSGGHITVYPGGAVPPLSATMNYSAGQIRANNAIVPLGPGGDVLVNLGQGAGTTAHLVIDVNGYFE